MNNILKLMLVLLATAVLGSHANAQTPPKPLTADEQREVIDSVAKLVNEQYIDKSLAVKIAASLSEKLEMGAYSNVNDPIAFSVKVTDDLIAASNDRHFSLHFSPEWVADSKKATTDEEIDELMNRDAAQWKKNNFGFKEVKILSGNIGYLKLDNFRNPKYAGETAASAMAFLGNTDAIIIDLRNNGGGFSTMVQLLVSYFFDGEPVRIIDMYSPKNDEYKQDWTLPYLSGKRLPDVDLYVLTSKMSFSAAESFAYFLKNRKRATIVGETTGGGAHPVKQLAVSDRFYLWLPATKPTDPITKTNWEGVGVEPDIATPAKDALLAAQTEALKKLRTKEALDEYSYQWILTELSAMQHPPALSKTKLQLYAGSYGIRKLIYENGELFYQRDGSERFKLIPLKEELFVLENLNFLRIKIEMENGKVTGITRLYDDGSSVKDLRTK